MFIVAETARELQETIMRMEHTMSGQPMGTDMTPMLVRPPTPMPTYYTKVCDIILNYSMT